MNVSFRWFRVPGRNETSAQFENKLFKATAITVDNHLVNLTVVMVMSVPKLSQSSELHKRTCWSVDKQLM